MGARGGGASPALSKMRRVAILAIFIIISQVISMLMYECDKGMSGLHICVKFFRKIISKHFGKVRPVVAPAR